MTAYDVEPGDSVHPGDPVTVDRYTAGARVNHWITATCLVLLALSGLALFSPWLFFLTALFGGGQSTRAIHPWIGVVLFFSFVGLFIRFWRANLWKAEDGTWLARLRDVLCRARGAPAGSRQVQCRPEGGVLADVNPDHRADQ